jgi:Tfp pilus assembly protein PilO
MSSRNRLILVAVVAALVSLLFFFFFIRGRQSELGDVREEIEAAESQTQQLNAQLARLKELQDNAPRLEAQLADIRSQVPEEDEVSNFIFQVQEAADEAGVGFVQMTPELPKPPPEGASLAQTRVVIAAEGGFFSLQDFVRRLQTQLDRAVRIDNLTISTEAGTETAAATLRISMTARIFFELTGTGAPTSATTTTSQPAPPPPASPSPTPAAEEETEE